MTEQEQRIQDLEEELRLLKMGEGKSEGRDRMSSKVAGAATRRGSGVGMVAGGRSMAPADEIGIPEGVCRV